MRTIGQVSAESLARVGEADGHRTLEKVVPWAAARGGDIVDIVVQDEFTHDVIVGVHGVFLVYDTT